MPKRTVMSAGRSRLLIETSGLAFTLLSEVVKVPFLANFCRRDLMTAFETAWQR